MISFTSSVSDQTPRFAVRADRWDRKWFEETVAAIPRLADVSDELADVHEAAPDAMVDLFTILAKAAPTVEAECRPDRAVNRLIAEQMLAADGTKDARRFTVGSQVQSALACLGFRPFLEALYADPDVDDAQEAAEKAQRAHDAVAALGGVLPGGGGEPGDEEAGGGESEPTAEMVAATAAADQADAELADALDRCETTIAIMCQSAVNEVAAEVAGVAESMASWGCGVGEWSRMDADEFVGLADQLSTPEMRQIAKVLGKMENLRIGAHREKVDTVPTEVWSVELGNDLGRLLPSEKIGLIVPELEDDFYRRLSNRQLLQYRLRSVERKAAGAVILIEDSSGSMAGEPHAWAKAFGLALGGIARDENRAFHAIEFGYRGDHKHHPFPDRAAWTTDARIDYATSFLYGGGTDFETVLDAAIDILNAEFEETGRVSADIVMLTDGLADISDEWLATFVAARERLGFKVYSLVIGDEADDLMGKFSDYIGSIYNFTDGSDVKDVFKAVA